MSIEYVIAALIGAIITRVYFPRVEKIRDTQRDVKADEWIGHLQEVNVRLMDHKLCLVCSDELGKRQ